MIEIVGQLTRVPLYETSAGCYPKSVVPAGSGM